MRLTLHVPWSAIIVASGVFTLTGCESAQQAGGLQQAINDYNAQKYLQARDGAKAISDRPTPGNPGLREDAAYIAGLSSYQLGDVSEADKQLTIATNSPDEDTVGRAKAMLGQVRLDQKRPRDAATLFSDSYATLDGPDARKAALNAAIAFQQAGDTVSSKKWLDMANGVPTAVPVRSTSTTGGSSGGSNPSAAPSIPAAAPPAGIGFTLQVGAFKDKERAKRAADEAEKLAQKEGLGGVRMMLRRDEHGMPTYLVQFGSFPTRDAAAAMRTKLGRLEYIVTATGGSNS